LKFIADGMLGRLTRWMRLLGEDVTYLKDTKDDELIKAALEEKRTLLTSDLALYKRARAQNVNAYVVEGKIESDRLAEIAEVFGIPLAADPKRSRCAICNGSIVATQKGQVEGRVPDKVFAKNTDFWMCSRCGKIYWKGGHWLNIDSTMQDVKRILKEDKGIKRVARS
jgi:uncharacterized protein with PIN domain